MIDTKLSNKIIINKISLNNIIRNAIGIMVIYDDLIEKIQNHNQIRLFKYKKGVVI